MIAIINYEAGNLASVSNALERLEVTHTITNKKEELEKASGVIFPGVGHARPAMKSLRKNRLDQWIKTTKKPVLGICLGMQLLYDFTEEGNGTEGLGLIPGQLKKFDKSQHKVPHMGWNTFSTATEHPLLQKATTDSFFYYVHSYYAPVNAYTVAGCRYITDFTAVVSRNNFMGVQFHPEKSGEAGVRLLQNFLQLVFGK